MECGVGRTPSEDSDATSGRRIAGGATLLAFGLCYRKASLALLETRQVSKLNEKMPSDFFKNRRVYLLTGVAYMGSLLFGMHPVLVQLDIIADLP